MILDVLLGLRRLDSSHSPAREKLFVNNFLSIFLPLHIPALHFSWLIVPFVRRHEQILAFLAPPVYR